MNCHLKRGQGATAASSERQNNGAQTLPDVERLDLIVSDIHCAGCIGQIERTLHATRGVNSARVNLSTKRVTIEHAPALVSEEGLIKVLDELGFPARRFDPGQPALSKDEKRGRELLRALAVAGFAAGNVMLLSVSVWSGAEDATRNLFHWISALIALPATAYAGRPFFRSAASALAAKRLNMDVPISVAIVLATGMSLFETMNGSQHVYFDAALMLCLFLLSGRYLDHMMRAKAKSAVTQLLAITPSTVNVIDRDGAITSLPISKVVPGMEVSVRAGDRVPIDGEILEGSSDLDRSIVTGEFVPEALGPGDKVEAGTANLTGPLKIAVTAVGEDTFLSEIIRLMEKAGQGKARYVRLADKAAQIYAPLVHLAAAITFAGWFWVSGDWHTSLLTAIAVLIITCPCALGLAVPAVQMVATGCLFRSGVLVKSASALERLAEIDTVIFDKTGTLTEGRPVLRKAPELKPRDRAVIAKLASESTHPLAQALSSALGTDAGSKIDFENVSETPGAGLSAELSGQMVRLGSSEWCFGLTAHSSSRFPEVYASIDGKKLARFEFEDQLRPDGTQTVAQFQSMGLDIILLSGDREPVVVAVAEQAGISTWQAATSPIGKVDYISRLHAKGQRALMIGDGINDAAALAAAHASISPSSASDIGRTAADVVLTGPELTALPATLLRVRQANRLVKQNFLLAAMYNMIAVPIAIAGLASPLVAAIAMSASSLLVMGNALRLHTMKSAAWPKQASLRTNQSEEKDVSDDCIEHTDTSSRSPGIDRPDRVSLGA